MIALHLLVLAGLGIAQPLFDLLSRHADFFAAHGSSPLDLVLLTLAWCLLPPALALLCAAPLAWVNRKAGYWACYAAVGAFAALIALQAISYLSLPPWSQVGLALLLGAGAAVGYARISALRAFLTFLSPAALLFPIMFLFFSPVRGLLFELDRPLPHAKVNSAAPVVMLVLDELPLSSLMDESHRIDALRYPNFAALAEDAYWFRNATTVAPSTAMAVPAMLTGRYPDLPRPAYASDYPENLFTLLGGTYDLKVLETVTALCPKRLCPYRRGEAGAGEGAAFLLTDTAIVYLHLLLPQELTSRLPSIRATWKGFAGAAVKGPDRPQDSAHPCGAHA